MAVVDGIRCKVKMAVAGDTNIPAGYDGKRLRVDRQFSNQHIGGTRSDTEMIWDRGTGDSRIARVLRLRSRKRDAVWHCNLQDISRLQCNVRVCPIARR